MQGKMHLIQLRVCLSDCQASHRNQRPGNSPQAKTGQEPASRQDIHLLDCLGIQAGEESQISCHSCSPSEPDGPRGERTSFISPNPLVDDHLPPG